MYIPATHAETDPARLHEFMRRNSFATLVSRSQTSMIASHLPLLLDVEAGSKGVLLGHMARANSQWRDINGEVLVIFNGPHVYVSPTWYESAATVPTWNYVAVHTYGTVHVVEDRGALLDILRRSVDTFESPRPNPWAFDESASHVDHLIHSIVGFRIEITDLQGKWKLSQNHPEERRRRVIDALEKQSDDDSRRIAAMMRDSMRRS